MRTFRKKTSSRGGSFTTETEISGCLSSALPAYAVFICYFLCSWIRRMTVRLLRASAVLRPLPVEKMKDSRIFIRLQTESNDILTSVLPLCEFGIHRTAPQRAIV